MREVNIEERYIGREKKVREREREKKVREVNI